MSKTEHKIDGETIALEFDFSLTEEEREALPEPIPVKEDDTGLRIFTMQGMDVFFVGYQDESSFDGWKILASFDDQEDAEWYKEYKEE